MKVLLGDGTEADAEVLKIVETVDESWTTYVAKDKDGKLWTVRAKFVLLSVRKLVGKLQADGTQAFQCPHNTVITVDERPDDDADAILTK